MAPRQLWLTLGLTVLILILFLVFVDFETVVRQLQQADKGYLLAASLLLVAGLLDYAARWRFILNNKPSLLVTFHASNVGHMLNTLIPLRAGEPARILALGRSGSASLSEITSSVVVERLFEQLMRLSAFAGAIAIGIGLETRALLGGLLFLLIAFGGLVWLVNKRQTVLEQGPRLLARLPRLSEARARQVLAGLLDGLMIVASPRQLALVFLWSVLTWSSFWVFHYLTLEALNLNLPLGQMLAISLGALALTPPSAPTQPGLYHASLVAPLVVVGFDQNVLTAYAIVLHALQMIWMIALGIWGLSQTGISLRQLVSQPAAPRS